jgi:hypothetical protein
MTSKKARGPLVGLGDRVDAARRVGRNELVVSALNTDELVRQTVKLHHRREGTGLRVRDVIVRGAVNQERLRNSAVTSYVGEYARSSLPWVAGSKPATSLGHSPF